MCREIAEFESSKNAEQVINELNLSDINNDSNSKEVSKTKKTKKK
jgi:hypothetical protein